MEVEYSEAEIECMVKTIVDTWYEVGLVLEPADIDMVRAILNGGQPVDELTKCLIERCKNIYPDKEVKKC